MTSLPASAGAPIDYASIVVGVDGSDGSVGALRHAVGIARKFDATVEAICAWSFPVAYTPVPITWDPEEDARKIVNDTADAVFGPSHPDWFTATVAQGAPADLLVARSAAADLIVVGSRGLGGFAGLLLGSVSSECAEHADCPVLIVHGHTDPAAENRE